MSDVNDKPTRMISEERRMRSDSVKAEEVEKAIDSITSRNETVTLKKLREEIGHGSMSTLSKLLCQLRANRERTDEVLFENNPVYREEAQKVAMKLVELAYLGNLEMAKSRVELVEKALKSTTQGYLQELYELGQHEDELRSQMDTLGSENRSLKAKVSALTREVNKVNCEKSKLEALLGSEKALRIKLEKDLTEERSRHNTVGQDMVEMLKQISNKLK